MNSDKTKLIDLSHTVAHGMITYTGLPGPVITEFLSRKDSRSHYTGGTTFHIGKIEMVANTGTYLDTPFHRYETGKDLSDLSLYSVANLDGRVFHAGTDQRAIDKKIFAGSNLKGKAVLVHTGWDRHWNTDRYFKDHPFLTRSAAEYLKASGAALVGIDSLNIDDTADGKRPAHSILLQAEIPIVEHMCRLNQLPDDPFTFFAVPVKVKGFGTFPVRAFAIVERPSSVQE